MDDGQNSMHNIMGKVDRFGQGFFAHHSHVFKVSIENPVRISMETLLSEALFELSWSQPQPLQDFPAIYQYYNGTRNG